MEEGSMAKKAKRRVAAKASANANTKVYSGVKKDPLDLRDLMYEGSLEELPLSLDNRPYVPFVLDQRKEGACTGFGLAAVVNYLLKNHQDQSLHPPETVSARMLYEMAKRYDEWEGQAYEGSSIRGAMKGWHKHGVCTDGLWKYYPSRPGDFEPAAQLDALQRPLGNYFRVRHLHLNQMHSAINEVGVLYVSSSVHEGWNKVSETTGRIPYRPGKIGGHAFAIVGYDQEGFWIQNSWGGTWGLGGFGHLSYDDWLENSMDCWVARLGVPTQSLALAGEAPRDRVSAFDYLPHEQVALSTIRPHFVNLGNDGRFSQSGRYSSDPKEVETVIKSEFAAKTAQWSGTPRLMLYAHGGLNNEKASASRIASLLPYFLENEIYPLHFMWETGVGETLSGIVQDAFRRGPLHSWREDMRKRFLDLIDEAVELGAKPLGRPLWNEMKENAERASMRGGGARYVAEKIADFKKNNRLELHLVGHSAGSIFHGHLVPLLIRKKLPIKSLTLFAPACTMELFDRSFLPHLGKRIGIERMTVFNLSDKTEQNDKVGPAYNKSLLYLVSESFEKTKATPLAGMHKFWKGSAAASAFGSPLFHSEHGVIHSEGGATVRLKTDSRTHGGFDNDEDTLNAMMRIILGSNRLKKKFEKKQQ
jgi:hypothetical protein